MARTGSAFMSSSIVFVVGLQKSGTTLLARLLRQTGLVSSPWNGEGHDFWGDVPPFSPSAEPAGSVYQGHGGSFGHEISAREATPEVRALLARRLDELPRTDTPFVVNKNPYNIVRVPWIRALFPDARIVAMVRRPAPNVFSLLKKHLMTAESSIPPEEGWWGVKPAGWQLHANDRVVERCAWQWSSINRKLHDDRALVDELVAYHGLCRDPTLIVERVLGRSLAEALDPIRCLDDEYLTGAELRSKNRYYWRTRSLAVPDTETVELDPFDADSVAAIDERTKDTASLFPQLA